MANSMVPVTLDPAVSCPHLRCFERGHDVQLQAIHLNGMENVISDGEKCGFICVGIHMYL
jgi:hypothetical protein